MERVSCWIIFLDFLNNNQGLIAFINILATVIIFSGILVLTWRYAKSTEDMAKENRNSVEVAKDSIDTLWDLRVEEVTFDLINDWYQIKMEIAEEEENVALSHRQEHKGTFLEIANYCVKPLEYFNKINELNKSGRIKKDLFFKNMKEEIIYFKEIRFKKIEKDYNKARNRLMQLGFTKNEFVKLDDKGLNEIYKIAKEINI